jgi:hypothetical protein
LVERGIDMTDQEKLEFKNKYMNNPVAFAKDFYGVKLLPYQKIMLEAMTKIDIAKSYITSRLNSKKFVFDLNLAYMMAMEMNFEVWSKNGIDVYEKGVLVKTIKKENK